MCSTLLMMMDSNDSFYLFTNTANNIESIMPDQQYTSKGDFIGDHPIFSFGLREYFQGDMPTDASQQPQPQQQQQQQHQSNATEYKTSRKVEKMKGRLEKPFHCAFCDTRFTTASHLARHNRCMKHIHNLKVFGYRYPTPTIINPDQWNIRLLSPVSSAKEIETFEQNTLLRLADGLIATTRTTHPEQLNMPQASSVKGVQTLPQTLNSSLRHEASTQKDDVNQRSAAEILEIQQIKDSLLRLADSLIATTRTSSPDQQNTSELSQASSVERIQTFQQTINSSVRHQDNEKATPQINDLEQRNTSAGEIQEFQQTQNSLIKHQDDVKSTPQTSDPDHSDPDSQSSTGSSIGPIQGFQQTKEFQYTYTYQGFRQLCQITQFKHGNNAQVTHTNS